MQITRVKDDHGSHCINLSEIQSIQTSDTLKDGFHISTTYYIRINIRYRRKQYELAYCEKHERDKIYDKLCNLLGNAHE